MKFDTLHEIIPYSQGGKQKILTMQPYNAICLAMPGRHSQDTSPVGGDFVVMVDDEEKNWSRHQFTHTDLFLDIEEKAIGPWDNDEPMQFMRLYLDIVKHGADPEKMDLTAFEDMPGLHPQTFFYAVQALAVAEHRRYSQHETIFGGRYLPFRFSAGIIEGNWTATDAIARQRRGRLGAQWLEKDFGRPTLTKELML